MGRGNARGKIHWDEVDGGIEEDLFNKIVLEMPLTLILKLRAHGIDLPKNEYGEKLED